MMSNQPLTPPYVWDPRYELDLQEFLNQFENLSDTPVGSDTRGLSWPYPANMDSDMTEVDVASNPGMVDSSIGSRSSTLSTYPESNTFNGDNSALVQHTFSSKSLPDIPAFPEPAYTCDTINSRSTVYIEDEDEESSFQPETGGLACPQSCGTRLKDVPGVKRHMKEQHQCAHPNCKWDVFPTKSARDKHQGEAHPDDVLGFQCGSCGLKGSPKRFPRVDKLRKHFKSVHRIQEELVNRGFQCTERSCLPVSDGGVFFAKREELAEHTQCKHVDKSKDQFEISNRNTGSRSRYRFRGVQRPLDKHSKHPLAEEPMTQSKRARIPDHGDLLSASRLSSGQFEQTLARSIRILDICNFVEDPRFPRVVEELKLLHVWTVFIRSIRAIKICGARSPDDMERALKLLNPLLPANNEKTLPESRKSPRRRSRPKDLPSVSTHLPLRPSEDKEAIYTWKTFVAPQVSDFIKDLPIGGSCSVTLVRQKGSLGKFEPVIRFHSPSQNRATRDIIRKKIREICSKNSRPEIPIQFSNGGVVLLVGGASTQTFPDDPPDNQDIPHERRYFKRPGMGISIGMTQCAHEFASLGGYILVGNTQVMLTVQHLEQKARDCVPCDSRGNLDNSLSSPAPADIQDLREDFEESLKVLGYTMENSDSTADEISVTTLAENFAEEIALVKQLKRFREHLSKPPEHYTFGKVMDHSKENDYVHPCLRREGGDNILRHRMDWAIYEVDKERLGKNKFVHPVGKLPSPRDIENEITNPYGTGEACTEWREFRLGEDVYYVGSQSSYREGIIARTYGVIERDGEVSQEWRLQFSTTIEREDVEGDSGAWILGKSDNKLLGLLWGFSDGYILFTPIREVLYQIQQKWPRDYVQIAGLDPGSMCSPKPSCSISGTKRRPYRPRCFRSKTIAVPPLQLRIETPVNSDLSITPPTSEASLSRSPSPTPSLMSSVSSFSESPSPSMQPLKFRSSAPYNLSDPFEKLDLVSHPYLMSDNPLLDGNDYPVEILNRDITEVA